LKAEDIALMNEKSIVFALSNPVPEIMPDEAKK
jgi:malic enzyme